VTISECTANNQHQAPPALIKPLRMHNVRL